MAQKPTIQLHVFFSGVETHEQVIKPGEYAVDDPALMGLANTLLDMGHASWVTMPVDEPVVDVVEDEQPEEEAPKPSRRRKASVESEEDDD